jgi:outer membrane receptor protein involved in Fe transport
MSLGTLSVNASYQYTGKRFADLANSEPSPLKAFNETVLGVAFTTKNRFTLRVSVNNVFNQEGLSEGDPRTGQNILDPSVSTFNARPILPRTITGTVSYRF